MKVYVVLEDSFKGTELVRIYANRESAENYCNFINDVCINEAMFCYYLEKEVED